MNALVTGSEVTQKAAMGKIVYASLEEWLAHCERLHPKNIDMGLERVREVAQRLNLRLQVPVITVAGTNGKGSTCAMLESIYTQAGFRTGLYTSPHLVHFQERCRLRGEMVQPHELLEHFEAVEHARTQGSSISLTYFEFTTLAILRCLSQAELDVVILEVGLGGRLDAVNVVDADCAVITSIDIDHTDFLGADRESIGAEKAGILRSGQVAVIGDPMPPQSVLDVAQRLGADVWRFGTDFNFAGDRQQWGWAGRGRRYSGLAYPALRGANQLINASAVLAVVCAMRARLPVTAQAVRTGLALVELPGRFQQVPGQPVIVLDVAHNPHSVAALAANLDAMGYYPNTHAVVGAMADKDLSTMLARMAPLVTHWYFCDLPTPRAALGAALQACWEQVRQNVSSGGAVVCEIYPHPVRALQAAIAACDPADRIVVFGSFVTVGAVLEQGVPRVAAQHVGAG